MTLSHFSSSSILTGRRNRVATIRRETGTRSGTVCHRPNCDGGLRAKAFNAPGPALRLPRDPTMRAFARAVAEDRRSGRTMDEPRAAFVLERVGHGKVAHP